MVARLVLGQVNGCQVSAAEDLSGGCESVFVAVASELGRIRRQCLQLLAVFMQREISNIPKV